MGPSGSTLRGHAGLAPLAARVLGGRGPCPPRELTALLLPMVKRVIRTERGPVALVRWLHQHAGPPGPDRATEQVARRLTEDLVRALCDPQEAIDGTLSDA